MTMLLELDIPLHLTTVFCQARIDTSKGVVWIAPSAESGLCHL